ncbi:hypothetical protein JXC34_05495 [Candidatus Woesearchaeota archaeon]|nr:hypothetical protein [Candidatus Woesearchaeota archaeon]
MRLQSFLMLAICILLAGCSSITTHPSIKEDSVISAADLWENRDAALGKTLRIQGMLTTKDKDCIRDNNPSIEWKQCSMGIGFEASEGVIIPIQNLGCYVWENTGSYTCAFDTSVEQTIRGQLVKKGSSYLISPKPEQGINNETYRLHVAEALLDPKQRVSQIYSPKLCKVVSGWELTYPEDEKNRYEAELFCEYYPYSCIVKIESEGFITDDYCMTNS